MIAGCLLAAGALPVWGQSGAPTLVIRRPRPPCPSLTDENGYFYPMMFPNPAYPGQSIMEQKWDIKEIEQEFRAQIETTLKSIPQLSHLSGHMLPVYLHRVRRPQKNRRRKGG